MESIRADGEVTTEPLRCTNNGSQITMEASVLAWKAAGVFDDVVREALAIAPCLEVIFDNLGISNTQADCYKQEGNVWMSLLLNIEDILVRSIYFKAISNGSHALMQLFTQQLELWRCMGQACKTMRTMDEGGYEERLAKFPVQTELWVQLLLLHHPDLCCTRAICQYFSICASSVPEVFLGEIWVDFWSPHHARL